MSVCEISLHQTDMSVNDEISMAEIFHWCQHMHVVRALDKGYLFEEGHLREHYREDGEETEDGTQIDFISLRTQRSLGGLVIPIWRCL